MGYEHFIPVQPEGRGIFEGINITNETVHKRGRFSNHLLLVQDAGARYALGVNITY